MFKNLKIKTKILTTVGIVGALVIVLAVFARISVNSIKENMVDKVGVTQLNGHKNLIKWETETMATVYATAIKGLSSDDEKKEIIRKLNGSVYFLENKSGYFFVFDRDNVTISHPLKPQLNGKSLHNAKDKNGVYFVKDMGDKAHSGGGYVKYSWPKEAGSDEVFPKLSYAQLIPGTEWWLGAGVYIDDVEAEKALAASEVDSLLSTYIWIGLGILVGYTLFVIFPGVISFSNMIVRPLNQIRAAAMAAQVGDFSQNVEYESKDEVGAVATAFRELAVQQRNQAKIAQSIANGDLTVTPKAASDKDTLGNALVVMVDKLNSVMSLITTASVEVDAGAKQVSGSSSSLSEGATTSAASIEEISSSMTEIESQVKASAGNATQANDLANNARTVAEKGSNEMANMLEAMTGISESSQQIAKIIKVIDDIAFQTNLLALNAAVEAARAGVHGKGFAVVAEEVRSLAGRSAKAAKETSELIEDAVKRVENGNDIAEKTGDALAGIVEQVSKVTNLVGEIASASNEQAQGVSQVSVGLEQIDSVTQSNTANAEETAAASQQLSAQATELQSSIAHFKIKGGVQQEQNRRPQISEQVPAKAKIPEQAPRDTWGRDNSNEDIISLDDVNFGRY